MPFSLGSIKMNTFQRQSNSLCLKLNLRNTVNQAACWKFRRSSISNLSFIDFPSRGILIGSNAGVSMPCGWNGYRILSPDLTNAACFVLRIFENITLKERLPFSFQQDLRPPPSGKLSLGFLTMAGERLARRCSSGTTWSRCACPNSCSWWSSCLELLENNRALTVAHLRLIFYGSTAMRSAWRLHVQGINPVDQISSCILVEGLAM